MALWLILLIAAVVLAIIGYSTAASWLFIVAVILLVVSLIGFGYGAPGHPRLAGITHQRLAATSSAICTALRAAPLRRLSLLTNSARPRPSGTPSVLRMRPT